MSSITFARFYPSDWRSGCIGMTFAEEGLYIRICAFIYETGQRIPLDDRRAAKLMGAHTNAYVAVKKALATRNKIQHHADGWTVERAERERALATRAKTNVDTPRISDDEKPAHGGSEVETAGPSNAGTVTPAVTPTVTMPVTPIVTHPVTNPVTGGVLAEKHNEINSPLESQYSIVRSKKESKKNTGVARESKTTTTSARDARAGASSIDPIVIAAIEAFNGAATKLNFSVCGSLTPRRVDRVAKRLAEIGSGDTAVGLERFRLALDAIPRWPFIAGREKSRDGRAPFRLDLERLLSTDSGMGDVLARLIDLGAEASRMPAKAPELAQGSNFEKMWADVYAEEIAAQEARRRPIADSPLATW
jgi:uncharacterized protein YdaU (DUF1376 family)